MVHKGAQGSVEELLEAWLRAPARPPCLPFLVSFGKILVSEPAPAHNPQSKHDTHPTAAIARAMRIDDGARCEVDANRAGQAALDAD